MTQQGQVNHSTLLSLGSPPKMGLHQRLGTVVFLTALRDDPQAVIVEVFEAVSSSLNELHLSVEALGDAVVFAEASHAGDGFVPAG